MAKIFRLYKNGAENFKDWNSSPVFPYNKGNRSEENMPDPDGASAKHEITSIPSPFARIDLVKNAFAEVCAMCKNGSKIDIQALDGNTIFHKMVSDSLDVGEIFFNFDKFKDQIEIITWNPSDMINELKESRDAGQKIYADSLEMYMQADGATYNFGKLKNIYLLNYKQGPQLLNIIGATSPASIFFSTANKVDYIDDISFAQDKPFDAQYQPLYKRDPKYLLMYFYLKKFTPDFTQLFPEVDEYLDLTYRAIKDQELKDVLKNVTQSDVVEFETITTHSGQRINQVEVLGFQLYQQGHMVYDSQFTIKSKQQSIKTLVLPVESGNKYADLKYTTGKWGTTNRAPYKTDEYYLHRALPFERTAQPYLTISDFLEDCIIRVPHRLNDADYFNGNISIGIKKMSYLLPLKPLFFSFFSSDELKGEMSDGKPMIEMESMAGGSVKVILRIPITGDGKVHYIEYSRCYYYSREADIVNNEGGMTELDFTAFIMPNIRFINGIDAIYRIVCVSTYSQKYNFSFFSDDKMLQDVKETCRNTDNSETYKAQTYSIEKHNFDYIQVEGANVRGLIIPNFKEQKNIDVFEFSVDLGTSNTHIEFRKTGSNLTEVFNFKEKDGPINHVFLPSLIAGTNVQDDLIEENPLIEKDFLPNNIENESDFHFPTRTVLSCANVTDWDNEVSPFDLINIPLTYEKRRSLQYNNVKYNIKWGKGKEQRMIEAYIECLMLMMRNKVLLNNGKLTNTKVTWFYPISMAPKRLSKLRNAWNTAYEKYFGEQSTYSMTESAAPIQYYFRRYSTATNLVNVDIGGGTTDIAFSSNKEIQCITSFRFASNVLFENPYSDVDFENGIIDYHKSAIRKLLEGKNLGELVAVFDSENNITPSNMASFLFSLKGNSMLKGSLDAKSVDFNHILQEDDNFRIVFILFYSAIIYHIAKIIKTKGLKMPRHIAFSGNGSKVIKVLTTDSEILAKYTKCIFEGVLGEPYKGELDILGFEKDNNPKESTCKGGLLVTDTIADDRSKIVVQKTVGNSFVTKDDTYNSVNEEYLNSTVEAVKEFFHFVLVEMNNKFNFDNNFGVSHLSLDIAKTVCFSDLDTYLEKGIAQRKEESEGSSQLEETFFFYPIKGVLNALSLEIKKTL